MQHDPLGQLGQLLLMAATGAFAGLARVLSLYDVKLTPRLAVSNILGGAVVAIVAGGFYTSMFPDKEANTLIIAAVSAAAGGLGFPWVIAFLRKTFENRVDSVIPPHQHRLKSAHQVVDETEFSVTTEKMMDSGEFSDEEVAQMIEGARKRKEEAAKKLGIIVDDKSRD